MRKVIAISVVFALIAGAAFAQASIGGAVDTRMNLLMGDSNENTKASYGGSIADGYLQVSGQDADGKFGGLVRVQQNGILNPASTASTENVRFHRAFAWWKPIPQLKIFLGKDKDGLFGTDSLAGWAFHQGGQGFITRHGWDYWRAVFPGNWDNFGFAFSIYPIQGLEVNLAIPTGAVNAWPLDTDANTRNWEDFPANIRLQVNYAIPDIGKVFLSYIGPGQNGGKFPENDGESFGNIGFSFLLSAVEGLQVQLGLATDLIKGDAPKRPLHIGLAAFYNAGDFGVKFRLGSEWGVFADGTMCGDGGNSWKYQPVNQTQTLVDGNYITFNVMPYYDLKILRAFLDIGFGIDAPEVGDSRIAFYINPFIVKSIGPGTIRFGVMIENNGNKDADGNTTTSFGVPVQFVMSF